ncbi:FkbM family methyltransferase [Polymorphobacter sp.]|uniref:FkbM family methyltransferase n=1 Tax=Polymorphobacter sp. TaxID=1909290 RepID=UPI003F6FE33E
MKEWLRWALRRRGWDVHRYLPTLSPDAQMKALLGRLRIATVLDIGANTGQYGELLRAIGYRGRIVSFEPQASAHAGLTATAAADPLWDVAPRTALGDAPGTAHLNIAGNSASSSLLPMLDRHRDAAPASAYVGTEEVPVARLDTAAAAWRDSGPLHLKIDTQGFERQVIAGAPETIAAAASVQLEVSLVPLYERAVSFEVLLAEMGAAGLSLSALWPGFADPASGQLLQIEAIFARGP